MNEPDTAPAIASLLDEAAQLAKAGNEKVRLDDGKHNIFRSSARRRPAPTPVHKVLRRFTLVRNASPGQY